MEEEFKLKGDESFMYDLYSNHAMNAILIKYDMSDVTEKDLAVSVFDIAEAMIIERRKRKAL